MTEAEQMPAECLQIWQNWNAFLDRELAPDQAETFRVHLSGCPTCDGYIESQRRFSVAVAGCLHQTPELPAGLRDKVCGALAAAECAGAPETKGRLFQLSFGMKMLAAAASILLMLGGAYALGAFEAGPVDAPDTRVNLALRPLLQEVSFTEPVPELCRCKEANQVYGRYFDGELPPTDGGKTLMVSNYRCTVVNGHRIMCAVYRPTQGDPYAVMTFKCPSLDGDHAPIDRHEAVIGGLAVVLWREGNIYRAIVSENGLDSARRIAEGIRPAGA